MLFHNSFSYVLNIFYLYLLLPPLSLFPLNLLIPGLFTILLQYTCSTIPSY